MHCTSQNAQVVWSLYDESDPSQKWYLETVAYQKGDVDTNGIIEENDAQAIISMAANIGSGNNNYSNKQCYLADYNQDEQVSVLDASMIYALIT